MDDGGSICDEILTKSSPAPSLHIHLQATCLHWNSDFFPLLSPVKSPIEYSSLPKPETVHSEQVDMRWLGICFLTGVSAKNQKEREKIKHRKEERSNGDEEILGIIHIIHEIS